MSNKPNTSFLLPPDVIFFLEDKVKDKLKLDYSKHRRVACIARCLHNIEFGTNLSLSNTNLKSWIDKVQRFVGNKKKGKGATKETREIIARFLEYNSWNEFIDSQFSQYAETLKDEHLVKVDNLKIQNITLPKDVTDKLKEFDKLIDDYKLIEAESLYKNEIVKYKLNEDEYIIAKFNKLYAKLFQEKDFNIEEMDSLLTQCLATFQKFGQLEDIIETKAKLAHSKATLGDLNAAIIFSNEFLDASHNNTINLARGYITEGFVYWQKGELEEGLVSMDKAILLGNKLVLSNIENDVKIGLEIIATGYHNKSFIYKEIPNITEAKAAALLAIKQHRKLNKKKQVGIILFQLTELEFFEGNFNESDWSNYIEEAKIIFREIKDFSWLARCIDLIAIAAYKAGLKELSLQIFEEGFIEIKRTKDKYVIAYFLERQINYFFMDKKFDKVEEYINELIVFSKDNNLPKSLTSANESLAELFNAREEIDKRDGLLKNIIDDYEKQFINEQSIYEKARIQEKIAQIKDQLNQLPDALQIYVQINKFYKEKNILDSYARTALIIIEIKEILGDTKNILSILIDLDSKLEGTTFYVSATATKLFLAHYYFYTDEFKTAKIYVEQALYLINKHKLSNLAKALKLQWQIDGKISALEPLEKEFNLALEELYDLIHEYPKFLEPLLRHWYYKNDKIIFSHFYQLSGVKALLVFDDIENINKVSKSLGWLFNSFFILSLSPFDLWHFDEFISPYKFYETGDTFINIVRSNQERSDVPTYLEQIATAFNNQNKKGNNYLPSYVFARVDTGKEKLIIAIGRAKGLPNIAYEFIKKNTFKQLIESKVFFSDVPRFKLSNTLYNDIAIAHDLKHIPVYINKPSQSDEIQFLSTIKTQIPNYNIADRVIKLKTQQLFNSLFNITKTDANKTLNNFKYELDILFLDERNKIEISISLIEVSFSFQKLIYPIIILNTF